MLFDDEILSPLAELARRDRRHLQRWRRAERRRLRQVDRRGRRCDGDGSRCRRRRRDDARAAAGDRLPATQTSRDEAGGEGACGLTHLAPPVTMSSRFPSGTTVSTTFGLVEVRVGDTLDVGRGHALVASQILLRVVRCSRHVVVRRQPIGLAEHRGQRSRNDARRLLSERASSRGVMPSRCDLLDLFGDQRRHLRRRVPRLRRHVDLEVAVELRAVVETQLTSCATCMSNTSRL